MTSFQQPEYYLELVNDSVMTRTVDGIINFWNQSAEKLYGWRKEEAIGKVSHNLLKTQFPKPLEEIESELVRTGRWEGRLLHTTRDGGRVTVESRWTLDPSGQPTGVVEINAPSTDDTTNPEASTYQQATEHKAQTLPKQTAICFQQPEYYLELVNDSVMTRTVDGIINFWNQSAEKLYGWRKEEAIGKVSHNLLKTQFPKPLEEIESELVRTGRWEGRLLHTTRDGGRVTVESRWTLDLERQSGAVVEVNARLAAREIDPKAKTDTDGGEIGRWQPVRKNKRIREDDLLPKIANIILGGGAFLCMLVALYTLYFHGWSASPIRMAVYSVLPTVLAVLLFTFLRQSPEFKVNAALVCVSVAVAIYAVEFLLGSFNFTAFGPSKTLWGEGHFDGEEKQQTVALAKKFGVDFDTRSRIEMVRDLRKQNIDAVPSIIPVGLLNEQPDGSFKSAITIDGAEVLPLSGISNRVTVNCNETGEYAIYKSDEKGFHNPQGIWESDRMAIAAVGDSFVEGACVPSDKNFVALIRERHPDTLNLGMSGEGPLITLAALKEYLPFVKPTVVLWFYFEENDFAELLQESKTPLLRKYLEDGFNQGLFYRQAAIDQALNIYVEQAIKSELARISDETKDGSYLLTGLPTFLKIGRLRERLGLVDGKTVQPRQANRSEAQLELFRDVLLQSKNSVSGWGGTLYFVYLPSRDRYANKREYHRQATLDVVKDIGLPIIDISESFQLRGDPLRFFPFRRFGHYNEEGNRVVAEEVLRSLAAKRSQ